MEEMAEVYFCTFFSFYFELSKISRKFAVSINLKNGIAYDIEQIKNKDKEALACILAHR